MSVAIHENLEAKTIWHPVRLRCRVTVDAELVDRCQRAGDRPHRGTPLGKMLELYPFDALKRRLMDEAKLFTKWMKVQGYEQLKPESAYEVWGPFMEKVNINEVEATWLPEEGNHLIPAHQRRKARKAWGYGVNELRDDKGLTFFIRAPFSAKYGKREEETGILIV